MRSPKLASTVKWRNLTFEFLGDRCVDCGCTDRRVFTVHHVNGDGKHHRHRETRQPSWKQYCMTVVMGTLHLEILCYNCHALKDLRREV